MHASKTRAVCYLRVSTDKQADKGVSLDAQRAKLAAYAALYDLEVVEVVVDAAVSASTLDRPGLNRALELLRLGHARALVVAKLDRLTRSVRDLGDLVERYFADGRLALLSVSEQVDTRTAAGRLVLNVLGSVSQWEREAIGERTSTAMAFKAAAGEFTGGRARYGYQVAKDGVRLKPVRAELQVIERAQALREEGLSLRAVARRLDALGLRNRHGQPFAHVQVGRMLRAYAAERRSAEERGIVRHARHLEDSIPAATSACRLATRRGDLTSTAESYERERSAEVRQERRKARVEPGRILGGR